MAHTEKVHLAKKFQTVSRERSKEQVALEVEMEKLGWSTDGIQPEREGGSCKDKGKVDVRTKREQLQL